MSKGELAGVELQPRDFALLRGLFESRVMTLAHIAALYFDGKKEMAKKRVQKLKAAGIIRERPRRHVAEPSVLFLPRKAFKLLDDHGHLTDYPRIGIGDLEKRAQVKPLTLRHELEVMDVKMAMMTAIQKTARHTVAEFSTWPLLYQFKACNPSGEQVMVKPDGFIRIHEHEADGGIIEHTFFLEVDRSTETLDILCQRCHCYGDYYRSGGLAVRNGRPREEYKQFKFRVLAVCKSAERRDNLARRLLENDPPIHTQVWIATTAEVKAGPLKAIWIRPQDCRDETVGTRINPYRENTFASYQRRTEHDELVNCKVARLAIF